MSEIEERAKRALNKKAPFGPDVDLSEYELGFLKGEKFESAEEIPENFTKEVEKVGVSSKSSSLGYFQVDQSALFSMSLGEGVEILPLSEAMKKYKWLKDRYFKLVQPDADKYTAFSALHPAEGYFIRVREGVKLNIPVQTCLLINKEGVLQNVHNIIIAERDSEIHILTGCTTGAHSGFHLGISEFYVEENAKISFTMIHHWAKDSHVRPRTGVKIERGGTFINNYICMSEVRSLQSYPNVWCEGENSSAIFNTITMATNKSYIDLGSRIFLRGKGSRAEIISRNIASKKGYMIARGHLIGDNPECRGHLECRGIILGDGVIHTIPEIEGGYEGVELSHEAAVGKIAEDEIFYLMSRGLSEEEATSIIVRGFMKVKIPEIPRRLKDEIEKIVDESTKKLM
jgi:hypothetical protein